MTIDQIRALTDIIYRALFDRDAAALRIHFGLLPCSTDDVTDDDIRDCMGIEALEALAHIEGAVTTVLQSPPYVSFEEFKKVTRTNIQDTAKVYRQRAHEQGYDLLTGKRKREVK